MVSIKRELVGVYLLSACLIAPTPLHSPIKVDAVVLPSARIALLDTLSLAISTEITSEMRPDVSNVVQHAVRERLGLLLVSSRREKIVHSRSEGAGAGKEDIVRRNATAVESKVGAVLLGIPVCRLQPRDAPADDVREVIIPQLSKAKGIFEQLFRIAIVTQKNIVGEVGEFLCCGSTVARGK